MATDEKVLQHFGKVKLLELMKMLEDQLQKEENKNAELARQAEELRAENSGLKEKNESLTRSLLEANKALQSGARIQNELAAIPDIVRKLSGAADCVSLRMEQMQTMETQARQAAQQAQYVVEMAQREAREIKNSASRENDRLWERIQHAVNNILQEARGEEKAILEEPACPAGEEPAADALLQQPEEPCGMDEGYRESLKNVVKRLEGMGIDLSRLSD